MLLRHHVKLNLLFTDRVCGHMAYGRIGGPEWGPLSGRTIVSSGETPADAARGLVERTPEHFRPKSLRSASWALEQALSLAAGAIQHGR